MHRLRSQEIGPVYRNEYLRIKTTRYIGYDRYNFTEEIIDYGFGNTQYALNKLMFTDIINFCNKIGIKFDYYNNRVEGHVVIIKKPFNKIEYWFYSENFYINPFMMEDLFFMHSLKSNNTTERYLKNQYLMILSIFDKNGFDVLEKNNNTSVHHCNLYTVLRKENIIKIILHRANNYSLVFDGYTLQDVYDIEFDLDIFKKDTNETLYPEGEKYYLEEYQNFEIDDAAKCVIDAFSTKDYKKLKTIRRLSYMSKQIHNLIDGYENDSKSLVELYDQLSEEINLDDVINNNVRSSDDALKMWEFVFKYGFYNLDIYYSSVRKNLTTSLLSLLDFTTDENVRENLENHFKKKIIKSIEKTKFKIEYLKIEYDDDEMSYYLNGYYNGKQLKIRFKIYEVTDYNVEHPDNGKYIMVQIIVIDVKKCEKYVYYIRDGDYMVPEDPDMHQTYSVSKAYRDDYYYEKDRYDNKNKKKDKNEEEEENEEEEDENEEEEEELYREDDEDIEPDEEKHVNYIRASKERENFKKYISELYDKCYHYSNKMMHTSKIW